MTSLSMVNAVPIMLPVKLRVSCTLTIVVWSLRTVGPETVAPCVNVIVPIPLFRWSSWSALVAAAVVTATKGIRKASSMATAQILNFILHPPTSWVFLSPRPSSALFRKQKHWGPLGEQNGTRCTMNSLSTGFLESDYLIPSLHEVIESAHRTARATLVYPSVQIKGASASC